MLQMGSIFILTTKTLSFFLSPSHILRWIVHRDTEILKKIFLMKIYPSGPPVVRATLEPVEGQEYWQSKLRGPPACLAPELQCWPEDDTCGPEELKKEDAEKCAQGVRQETQGLRLFEKSETNISDLDDYPKLNSEISPQEAAWTVRGLQVSRRQLSVLEYWILHSLEMLGEIEFLGSWPKPAAVTFLNFFLEGSKA